MTSSSPVVTRFAPSPTGYLHIGGARTALFNWLYARGRGGKFLLRIEDTDRARSTDDAVTAILNGLTWLGLDWDGEPVSQAARVDAHVAAAEQLLRDGKAYCDYSSQEETEALKAELRGQHQAFRSPWRDRPATDAPDGATFVVRFAGPRDGETHVSDTVQGDVRFPNKDLDDLVLLRSDGTPTYNLAVVVDDHDMEVTHVIRGDDHLVNAARQTLIYEALGWSTPVFAHIPLIHGPDGKKLSKRHGALGVEAYRDQGYLAAGLRNYLLRLGWSHGDQEIFTDDEARETFDITGINKAPARLDFDKMASVNAHHLRAADDAELLDDLLAYITVAQPEIAAHAHHNKNNLLKGLPFLKDRAKTLANLADQASFLLQQRPVVLSDKARKALNPEARERVARAVRRLEALKDWTEADIKAALDAFVADEDVGFGKVGGPIRAALTGGAPAPDLAVALALLGRDEAIGRIHDALATAEAS